MSWAWKGVTGSTLRVACVALRQSSTCKSAKLKQRNPLRVADVVLLERICCGLEGKSAQDRHAAGFFLFLLYARARYSDGQNVASLADSPKYLEFKVGRSKTSFTLERKTRFLPMAARKVGGQTCVGYCLARSYGRHRGDGCAIHTRCFPALRRQAHGR